MTNTFNQNIKTTIFSNLYCPVIINSIKKHDNFTEKRQNSQRKKKRKNNTNHITKLE